MVDENELDKLREERMNQIQNGDGSSAQDQKEQAEKQKQQLWEKAKQYMSSDARERLSTMKIANEHLAISVAQQITMLGESGRVSKVDDDQMKNILRQIQKDKKQNQSDIKFRK
jgi:DNA-binding TFAR19-related protein (PDSD5 family)